MREGRQRRRRSLPGTKRVSLQSQAMSLGYQTKSSQQQSRASPQNIIFPFLILAKQIPQQHQLGILRSLFEAAGIQSLFTKDLPDVPRISYFSKSMFYS